MQKSAFGFKQRKSMTVRKCAALKMSGFILLSANAAYAADAPQMSRPGAVNHVSNIINQSSTPRFTGAVSVHGSGQQLSSAASSGSVTSGLNLDLSSVVQSIILTNSTFSGHQDVSVNVGSAVQTFHPGDSVTAAQYAAIRQILATGTQSLTLGDNGAASGGKFSLNYLSRGAAGITVPQNVTALGVFSPTQNIAMVGDIINNGTISGIAAGGASHASISALNIVNSGLITTNMSATPLSLTLMASNNITNTGTISSSGALNLIAGGNIVNSSSATMSAASNISLFTGAGNLTNAGLINSVAGNININTNPNVDLNINALGGTFQALAGSITIRDSVSSAINNINLTGGNYLSQSLNLYGGMGAIEGSINDVTGVLTSCANVEHFSAATKLLTLGDNTLHGDPTFVNTAGDILITGTVSNGPDANLAIIASGNITGTASALIDTSNNGFGTNNGANVYLIAGAKATVSGATSPTTDPPFSPSGTAPVQLTSGTVTVDFSSSGTGGNVDLSARASGPVIDTHGTVGNGGNVTVIALSDASGAVGGNVNIASGALIDTSGGGTAPGSGVAGDVTIIGTSSAINAAGNIHVGTIFAGGQAQGGKVVIANQSISGSLTFDAVGQSSGSYTLGSPILTASVVTGDIVTGGGGGATNVAGGNGGSITINTGSNIQTGALISYGGGGGGGSIDSFGQHPAGAGAGGSGGDILVQSSYGTYTANGDLNSSGGGGGGQSLYQDHGGGSSSRGTIGAGGKAGTITVETSNLTINGSVLAVDGGDGGKGTTGDNQGSGGGGGSFGGGGGGGGHTGYDIVAGNSGAGGGGGGYSSSGAGKWVSASGGGGASAETGTGTAYGGSGGGVFGLGSGGTGIVGQTNTDGKAGTPTGGGDGGGFVPGVGGKAPGQGGASGGDQKFTGGGPSMDSSKNADVYLNANGNTSGSGISVAGQIYGKSVDVWAFGGNLNLHDITGSNRISLLTLSGNITPDGLLSSGGDIYTFASASVVAGANTSFDTTKGVGTSIGNIYVGANCTIAVTPGQHSFKVFKDVSVLGGDIDMSASSKTPIFNTSSSSKNGGNIVLFSQGGINFSQNGKVALDTSSRSDTAGDVYVISTADAVADQNIITLGGVFAGGQLHGGNVNVIVTSGLTGYFSLDSTGKFSDVTNSGYSLPSTHAKISLTDIVTGGGGGFTSSAGKAQTGGSSGNIFVYGGQISSLSLLAYGGGGGGGFGEVPAGKGPFTVGGAGGDGGAGGTVSLVASGNVSINNMINVSGGGGGGASGAPNITPPVPAGGKGGQAGAVFIDSSTFTVGNGIFAVDGADGGDGGAYTPAGPPYAGGGGGGGGASYGGGGGGGAGGGAGYASQNGGAGGGGGGGLQIGVFSVDQPYLHAGGGGGGGSSEKINGGGQGGGVFGGGSGGSGSDYGPTLQGYGSPGANNGAGGNGGTVASPGYTPGTGGAATKSGSGGQSEGSFTTGSSGGLIPLANRAGTVVSIVTTGDANFTSDILSAGAVSVKSGGAITYSSGKAFASSITLTADKDIGSSSVPFSFYAPNVTATSMNGSAYLKDTTPAVILGQNSAAGTWSLNDDDGGLGTGASITISNLATINAPVVSLVLTQSVASPGSIIQLDPIQTPTILTGSLTATISNSSTSVGIQLGTTNGTLPTALTNVTTNNGNIDIYNVGSVTAQSVTASNGNVSIQTSTDTNGNGAILIGTLSGKVVTLTSTSSGTGNGGISQVAPLPSYPVTANTLFLTDTGSSTLPGSHDIAVGFGASTASAFMKVNTSGNVNIHSSITGTLSWSDSSANNFSLTALSSTTVANLGKQNFPGSLTLNVGTLENKVSGAELVAATVDITGAPGKPLIIANDGFIKATALDGNLNISSAPGQQVIITSISSAGTLAVTGGGTAQINILAPYPVPGNSASVVFSNNQHLRGPAIITAQGPTQSISVGSLSIPNVLVDGDSLVWLKTPFYNQTNGGQITGNPLIVGAPGLAGTIANSQGDVNLASNLTFVGSSLAILASGNINSTGLTSINLAGNNTAGTKFGGDLTLIAGYNFTPSTGGQVGPTSATYTVTSQSTGGSINLSGVSIDLSSTANNVKGGTLTAVAHNGSISLGSINTSAIGKDSSGGVITIIGQNGVTVGAINSTGAVAGDVSVSASDSQLKGTTVVSNGSLIQGGFKTLAGTFNNNIALQGNLNAGSANVSLNTGASGAITAVPGSSITAAKLTMTAGTGGIGGPGASISTSAPIISANALGNVYLTSSAAAASLLASSGSIFNLTYTGIAGILSLDGALSADNLNLSSTNNGSFIINAQIAGLNNPNANSVSISANGTGTIADTAQLAPTIQTSLLNMSSGTGTIGTSLFNVKTNASTLTASTNSATVGGGVFIDDSNTSAVTINGLSAGSTLSSIVFTGQASVLSLDGQVSGNSISISNQGAVNVNNKITGAGAVSVTASGNLSVQNVIQGVGITLQTQNLSGGSITIDNKVSSTGSTIDVLSDGNITTSNTLSGTAITLQSTGSSGTIKVGGTVTGTGLVTLSAKGDLSTSSPISAGTLAVSTSAGSSGSVNLGGSINVTADADIAADNNITTSGSITGAKINVHNSGTTGNIKIGGTITGSGLVTLSARGDLSTSNQIKGDGITMSTSAGSGGNINAGGVLNSTKAVSIQSDNDIVTGASIKGTSITLTNTGTIGSMTLGGSLNGTGAVTLSAKGDLSSSSLINGSSIDMTTAAGSSGSITIKGPVSSSGNVTLKSDNNISTTATISGVNIALTNAGPSGGTSIGGTVTGTGTVDVNAAGNVDVKSAITGNKVTLKTSTGTNGNINIGANVTATDSVATDTGVTLDADGVGAVTQTTGVIGTNGSIVSIKSASGDLGALSSNLVVNAATLTANTAGNVFVRSAGAATTLDSSSGNIFQMTALGNLTVGGLSGGLNANFISLSTLNNGNLTLAAPINGLAGVGNNASVVNLTVSGTGAISDTSLSSQTISADTLTLTAFTGDIGNTPLTTNAASISANTKGSVYLYDNNKGVVLLGASSGKDFNLTAETVSLSANSTFSGTATITTNTLTNPANTIFTAATLNVTNVSPGLPTGPLTVNNGGALVANGIGGSINITSAADQTLFLGNNGGSTPGTLQIGAQSTAINITAQAKSPTATNQVIFTGNQNFIGDTVINANDSSSQEVTVNTGVTVQGFSKVTVNSNTLNLQGILIGNPLIFNSPTGFGTIANSQGNVLLSNSSSFVFHGQSLAIIAANNIIALNPILIDLSSNSSKFNGGNGGSLNLLAGFNFTPGTGGQVGPNGVVYQISQSPNALGGSIQMSNVSIKTGTTINGALAGNVLAAAHAGSLNNGSIALGSIDASAPATVGSTGGSITLIGNGIQVGNINTQGSNSGNVSLSSAAPQILGTIVVQNGNFTVGTVQADPTTYAGNIGVNSINAGTGSITMQSGGTGSITLLNNAALSSATIDILSGGAGGIKLLPGSSMNATTINLSAGSAGIQQLDSTALITTSGTLNLVTTGGDIGSSSIPLNISSPTFAANASGTSSVYLTNQHSSSDITVNDSSAGGTFQVLASSAVAHDIVTALAASISAPTISISSTAGNINVTTGTVNKLTFIANNGTVTLGSNTVSVVPDANGNGGSITLNAATIAPPSPTTLTLNANGTGNGNGGTIVFTSGLSSALTATLVLNANAAGTGNGGTVQYTSLNTAPLVIGNGAANLQINATGGSVGSTAGSGGTASVTTGGSLTVNPAQLNVGPRGSNGSGSSIALTAGTGLSSAVLTINASSMSNSGVGNGSGGSFAFTAPNFAYLNSGTQAFSLTANGAGTGSGGSINYNVSSIAPLTIGGGANSLNLSASSGLTGGNGGSLTVITGGNLSANPANLFVQPLGTNGNGGVVNLQAGSSKAAAEGLLLVTGAINANGKGTGVGGSVSLTSRSATTFTLGNPSTLNGITGAITVAGTTNGDVTVTNFSGGIDNSFIPPNVTFGPGLITKVRNLTFVAGNGDITIGNPLGTANQTNSIVLSAGGNVIEKFPTIIVSAKSVDLTSGKGTLGSTKTQFKVTASNVSANASGLINISDTTTTGVTIGTSAAGGTFTFTTPSAITTTGAISSGATSSAANNVSITVTGVNKGITIGEAIVAAGGTIKLTANGKGAISDTFANRPDSLQASTLLLTGGAIGQIGTSPIALRVTADNVTNKTTGLINIASNGVTPISFASFKTTNPFNLTAQGDVIISAASNASSIQISTGNNGSVNLKGNLGSSTTTSLAITAGGSGNITTSDTKFVIAAKSVTLASSTGNISGPGSGALTVSSPLLAASTGGAGIVNISDTSIANTTLANSSSGGKFTLLAAGSLTLNNISSTGTTLGGISVTTKGAALTTTGTINSKSGDILLNASKTTAKITIGGSVSTEGASGAGNVSIGIGTLPFATGGGKATGNVTLNPTGTGTINLGVSGITGPTSGTAIINAKNAAVVISTGAKGKANQIVLQASAVITGDPPNAFAGALSDASKVISTSTSSTLSSISGSNSGSNFGSNSGSGSSIASASQPVNSAVVNSASAQNSITPPVVSNYNANGVIYGYASYQDKIQAGASTAGLTLSQANTSLMKQASAAASSFSSWNSDALSGAELSAFFCGNEKLGIQSSSHGTDIRKLNSKPGEDSYQLNCGSSVFATDKDTIVTTPEGTVHVAAKSVVLLMVSPGGLAVFNFNDAHANAVRIETAGKLIPVAPCHQATLVTGDKLSFADANPLQAIAYRSIESKKLGHKQTLFSAEFHLPQAAALVSPLKQIMSSSDPQMLKLKSRMLKTSAIVMMMNQKKGIFQQQMKRALTAYAN